MGDCVVAQPVNVECYGVRPTLIWQVDEQMSRFAAAAAGEFCYWVSMVRIGINGADIV